MEEKKYLEFNQTLEVTFIRPTTDRDQLDKDAKVQMNSIAKKQYKIKTVYFTSKPLAIINEVEIKDKVQLSVQEILKKIGQWLSEGSCWTAEEVDSHYLTTVKNKPMQGFSYIQLPPELRNSLKGLISLKK